MTGFDGERRNQASYDFPSYSSHFTGKDGVWH